MGAASRRLIKLLLLVSLVPLALRATSLLLPLGGGAPAPSRRSWERTRPATATAAATGARVVRAGSARSWRPYRQLAARRRRRAQSSLAHAPDDAGDWFQDDKRLAPTGSNPLHNLR